MEQTNMLDQMDALLDGTLDDLADIPEFRVYPVGAHKILMSWNLAYTIPNVFNEKGKESSGLKRFIALEGKAIETVELPAGSTDTPLEAGVEFRQLFDLTNEYAQGSFKSIMKSLADHYGAKSNRELIADSQNAEVVISIKHRKDKTKKQDDGSPVVYAQIDTLMVV
jgi:hypothetical protein